MGAKQITEKLYDADSHLREFSAKVESCEKSEKGYIAVLDKTAFSPEGGGQGADKGTIDGITVLDVQIENGVIYHYLEKPVTVKSDVYGKLDWERRFRNMQNHSGEHIISGLVYKLYGFENIGFHLGDTEMTLDFNGVLTRDNLLKIERLANEAIYKNAKINTYYPDSDKLSKMQYRSKLDLSKNIRIVEIEDYDVCTCCAPHVSSACEIGIIKILDFYRNKGGVRLFVRCGIDALDDYNIKYQNIQNISVQLSVKQHETAIAVEKLAEQMTEFKLSLAQIKKRFVEEKVRSFNPETNQTAVFASDLDIKELQLLSDALNKKCPGIRGVFSFNGNGFAFAICGREEKLDLFFKDFSQRFTVRGGGRNGMVQGIVFAEKEEITAFFTEREFK